MVKDMASCLSFGQLAPPGCRMLPPGIIFAPNQIMLEFVLNYVLLSGYFTKKEKQFAAFIIGLLEMSSDTICHDIEHFYFISKFRKEKPYEEVKHST